MTNNTILRLAIWMTVATAALSCADTSEEEESSESRETSGSTLDELAEKLTVVVAKLDRESLLAHGQLAKMIPAFDPTLARKLAQGDFRFVDGAEFHDALKQYGKEISRLAKELSTTKEWQQWVNANDVRVEPPRQAANLLTHYFKYQDYAVELTRFGPVTFVDELEGNKYLPKGLVADARRAFNKVEFLQILDEEAGRTGPRSTGIIDNKAVFNYLEEKYPGLSRAYVESEGNPDKFRAAVAKAQTTGSFGFCRYGFGIFVALMAVDLASKGVTTYEDARRQATKLEALVAAAKDIAPPAVGFGVALYLAKYPWFQKAMGPVAILAVAAKIYAEGLGKDNGEVVQTLGLAVGAVAGALSFGGVAIGALILSEIGALWHEKAQREENRKIAKTVLASYNKAGGHLSDAAVDAFSRAPYERLGELSQLFSQQDLAGEVSNKIPWIISMGDHSAKGVNALYASFPSLQGKVSGSSSERGKLIEFFVRTARESRRVDELEIFWNLIGDSGAETSDDFCTKFQQNRVVAATALRELCPGWR